VHRNACNEGRSRTPPIAAVSIRWVTSTSSANARRVILLRIWLARLW